MKMRCLIVLAALMGLAMPAVAQTRAPPQVVGAIPGPLVVLGYCQLSVTTSVSISTCSGGVPSGAAIAYVTTEGNAIRYRDDGTAPTTSVGVPVAVGAQLIYSGNVAALQIVAQAGTAVVDIGFYR
jgi:hypothetical protein